MSKNYQTRAYPFSKIEEKTQKIWAERETFKTAKPKNENYYILDMFPYPSGSGLHVGHVEGYTASDVIARKKRRDGFNVLHPMGWDAFGLPAEQFAAKTGAHPRETTKKNIDVYRKQMQRLGLSYDWMREFATTDDDYVKWTQWIFLQLYKSYFDEKSQKARPISELESEGLTQKELDKRRLAYPAQALVNWCPALGTALANEEVIDGKSERGGYPVERRPMRQWMLRITAYAERLLADLDELDWPEHVKNLQRNWIGKSTGAELEFAIHGFNDELTVFTTRPDTLYGASFCAIAPEHPLLDKITSAEKREDLRRFRAQVAAKSDLERADLAKEKLGFFCGAYAINPLNDEKIPIWAADYVLMAYGSGAIMAVPAHDERDFDFANKYKLPIRQVVSRDGEEDKELKEAFVGKGVAINSPLIDGLATSKAKEKITAWLETQGLGRLHTQYKLRDWLFSRQRYWGEPFPIIWHKGGEHSHVDENDLPLTLPDLSDYKPGGELEPMLAKAVEWTRLPDGKTREQNTMPNWAGSCWYYLRFLDPKNAEDLFDPSVEKSWSAGKNALVDLYIGGVEHAVLHLLYARFWHKFLHDIGKVSCREPFQKLVNQGMILGEDHQKMSKSFGNVVSPDEIIAEYGADSLRLFELFLGPIEQSKPWSTKGIQGAHRFLARVWRLAMQRTQDGKWQVSPKLVDQKPSDELLPILHACIKKTNEDLDKLAFNTAIAQLMELTNKLTALEKIPLYALEILLSLLEPLAPHIAEYLFWRTRLHFGKERKDFHASDRVLLCQRQMPSFDETLLKTEEVEYVAQVNGKVRGRFHASVDADDKEIEKLALALDGVRKHCQGKEIRRVIVVRGRLVNLVAN